MTEVEKLDVFPRWSFPKVQSLKKTDSRIVGFIMFTPANAFGDTCVVPAQNVELLKITVELARLLNAIAEVMLPKNLALLKVITLN